MLFLDTETCGLHGPTVLIQYAFNKDKIYLHSVWTEKVKATLELLDEIIAETVVGFNLAFDWFHVCQTYTTLLQLPWEAYPIDLVDQYAIAEERARLGPCVKPAGACDVMLHARKGPYQATMDRKDVRIKRVPTVIAWDLAEELNRRIPLNPVYFARRKDKMKRWIVEDIKDTSTHSMREFKNVVLKFAPSSALKALAADALKIQTDTIKLFADVELPRAYMPKEYGFAPYALAVGQPGKWNGAWPEVIQAHARHWAYNDLAREYASDDVKYTRMLYDYFGSPNPNDVDSILACLVGAVRWRGYRIDVEGIKKKRYEVQRIAASVPFNYNSTRVCKKYLEEVMSPEERAVLEGSTKRIILEAVSKWSIDTICESCQGLGCSYCDQGLVHSDKPHPAAIRAKEILDARSAAKEIEVYDKLILAGRFHASFKVIGTLSGRMSGSDDLNPQGIKRDKTVRKLFPLADPGMILTGGDYESFEVVLADSTYNDPVLRTDLQIKRICHKCKGSGCKECDGKGETDTKIHALFGEYLFPPMTYDEIMATKGLPGDQDKYTRSKNGVFAKLYGGEDETLVTRVGVDLEAARTASQRWNARYKVWAMERTKIFNMFCSMRQPGGIGTAVQWHTPADYIETKAGFRRYFTLENQICKVLFDLANKPPKHWSDLKIKVWRRDREQTAGGAARSACFAAAFAIQAANMRAAANHVIQGYGAHLTKELQCAIWTLQPSGVYPWHVQPMNVHDEIMNPTLPELVPQVEEIVTTFIENHKKDVPLLGIDWSSNMKTWADK